MTKGTTEAITKAIEALEMCKRITEVSIETIIIGERVNEALAELKAFKEGVNIDLDMPVDSYLGEVEKAAKHLLEEIAKLRGEE